MAGVFPHTDIYAITDSRQSLGRSNIEVVQALLDAEVRIIQYREKDVKASIMLDECLAIRALTKAAGCFFIVNDHVDIALLCEADGIHLGQGDLPLKAVRSLAGKHTIIGVSASSIEELETAEADGADYIGVGPIYSTATKLDGKVTGLDFLRCAVEKSHIPLAAIGGINGATLPDVLRQGVRCCCMVSALTLAKDIPTRVKELRNIMKQG